MFKDNPGNTSVTMILNNSSGQSEVKLDLKIDLNSIKEDLINLIRLKGESL
jgi:hypothetical protein